MDINNHNTSPAGIQVNTVVLTFTLVAGLVVFLRLFTRLLLSRMAGLEDLCICIAMTLSLVLTVKTSEQVMHGLGRHQSQLSKDERLTFLKTKLRNSVLYMTLLGRIDALIKPLTERQAFWTNLWVYSAALTIIKVSILIQYLRIFPVRRFQKYCFLILGVVIAYGSWTVFGNIFLCSPIAFFWDKSATNNGHCMDRTVVWFANAGVNIALDMIIFLLPLPLTRTLQISKSQRRGLLLIFGLSASVATVSVIRIYSLHDVAKSDDLPFYSPTFATLSAVEVDVGIICACLPAMRPLLARMMPDYFSAAAQYTNVPVMLDPERQTAPKRLETTTDSTRGVATRTQHVKPHTVFVVTPQAPRSNFSRSPSGYFSLENSRPSTSSQGGTLLQLSQPSHSRSGSNLSVAIASAEAPLNGPRFQGAMDPLRMSPISPPVAARGHPLSSMLGPQMTDPNGTSSMFSTAPRPRTLASTKPLPITPFPVNTGG
ncbi:hypothetical protein FB567DRAFT_298255 [Paraphoma chrysanthemicola]|uniref:Rhodopsin domain-containing protein n=1 Tax=Paraphoma chrysanthemicola TaxID=798071 RepID=A0A8K0W249_9PLEO|nr:hypothetical protein FB567DRAFT_298255 [Paraphoma chrysanthemicola]